MEGSLIVIYLEWELTRAIFGCVVSVYYYEWYNGWSQPDHIFSSKRVNLHINDICLTFRILPAFESTPYPSMVLEIKVYLVRTSISLC